MQFTSQIQWGLTALSATAMAVLAGCSAPDRDSSAAAIGTEKQAATLNSATQLCEDDPRVELGLVSLDACVGAELFFRDDFGGNGRTCGSCHPVANNYTIDPTFIATLPNTDPLFVAEFDPALADLERPDLMRDHGLILENVDGADDPNVKFTMRSVPHCLSLSTSIKAPDGTVSPPLERTGWSGDGAPNNGELRDFQSGAIFQHYTKSLNRVAGTDFTPATDDELDAIVAFMADIGRTNELDLGVVTPTDAGAEAGRIAFLDRGNRCNGCHRNAGANGGTGVNRNFDTAVEKLRLNALNTQGIPFDGGFGGNGLPAFNFDANGDGVLDSFGNGEFNTTPLIEAADTGPFFHTNAFETIEDAIAFYNTPEFNNSPSHSTRPPIAMSPTVIADIGRFLRVLNAAFNVQMAVARADGALQVIIEDKNKSRPLQQEMLRLALVEVEDALEVLGAVSGLNVAVQANLSAAQGFLQSGSTHASHTQRRRRAEDALVELAAADAGLGTGMGFTMGAGTLLF